MHNVLRDLAATTILLGGLAVSASAADDVGPKYAEDTLTGDWNGLRSHWHSRGLVVDLGYKWDLLRVTDGGRRRGGQPMGHVDVKLKGDGEKLAGWHGATAFVNFIYDRGGKINRDNVGSQLGVSNIEVPVDTTRFFQAWVEQSFADGEVSVLGGLYPIDTEFQVIESAGLFVQPPYGPAPDLALTRGPSIFNNPAVGVRVKWQSNELGVYAMAAVLDGMPGDPRRPRGTHVRFQNGDGTMQIAEAGYRPTGGGQDGREADLKDGDESFGKFAFGYWRYTAKVDDLVDVDIAGNPVRRNSSGWYALAERTLARWNTGNLAGFFRFGRTDGDSTAIRHTYNVGVRLRGVIPGREDDVFGVAQTRATVGNKFRRSQAAAGVATTTAESAVEITYRIQVSKSVAVQPVMQFYRHPGAASNVPNATVVGARLELAL